ncbi:MAG: phosphatase PAP2 family protein [Planctomycetaceae bacterium]
MLTTPSRRGSGLLATWDLELTLLMNRSLSLRGVQPFFALISWLGNGKFWYALLVLLPLFSSATGRRATTHMLFVGIVNLVIYKLVKSLTQRPRPCNAYHQIMKGAVPLDEFSFPSGHTMHAVGFSIVAIAWFPQLTALLAAFTLLIALSRVILGLHYPTDVLLGAALGFAVAKLSFLFIG